MEGTKETQSPAIFVEVDQEDTEFLRKHHLGVDLLDLLAVQGTRGVGHLAVEEVQG